MTLFNGTKLMCFTVANPGFPIGGHGPIGGGGVDLQHGCFSAEMYAKMKELGPMGGGACSQHAPLDLPMLYMII